MKKEGLKAGQVKASDAAGEKSHWNKQVLLLKKPEDKADDVGPTY